MKKQDILENQAKVVFLGIGSNLGIRKRNIEKAKFLLADHNLHFLLVSSYYETPSWPDPRKPKFLNIILKLKCFYSPQELLKICKFIENQLCLNRIYEERFFLLFFCLIEFLLIYIFLKVLEDYNSILILR